MVILKRMSALAAFGAMAITTAHFACAQDYPTRPIRMIVPFGPGTGSDVLGRVLAQKLATQWGQTVVI